jgi:hypothetical protein
VIKLKKHGKCKGRRNNWIILKPKRTSIFLPSPYLKELKIYLKSQVE